MYEWGYQAGFAGKPPTCPLEVGASKRPDVIEEMRLRWHRGWLDGDRAADERGNGFNPVREGRQW
jgi:hypothetical protein